MNNNYDPRAIAQTIDVDELYDLDITIAKFILPRLIAYKQHCERTPRMTMTREEWDEILDKMIYAFERIACQTEEDTPEYKAYIKAIWNNEEDLVDLKRAAKASLKPISEGLSLYHKYYRSLVVVPLISVTAPCGGNPRASVGLWGGVINQLLEL